MTFLQTNKILEEECEKLKQQVEYRKEAEVKYKKKFRNLEVQFGESLVTLKRKGLVERQRVMKLNEVIFKTLDYRILFTESESAQPIVEVNKIVQIVKDVSFKEKDTALFIALRKKKKESTSLVKGVMDVGSFIRSSSLENLIRPQEEPDSKNLLEVLPKFERGSPLTKEEWLLAFSEEGRLSVDPGLIRKKFFRVDWIHL